ncbi:hypothetical protein [Magnetococcus sp. PR-3]|uniref:hypothetical protein n=1 Tax=Magnetococcus sp. PR-3 TaxID=3120355 RepID=UPI002FCE32ED
MENLVSQADYARHRGVSRKTVTQWKREGILVLNGAKVDMVASDRALAAAGRASVTHPSQGNAGGNRPGNTVTAAQGNKPAGMKPVPTAAVHSVRETLQESGQPVGPGGMTFMQAKTADMVLRAQLRKIELEEKKRSLIDREKVLSHVFKNARQFRDAWQNWPSRVASRMAAELGVDDHQMHLSLEQYVREHLEEISDQNFTLE